MSEFNLTAIIDTAAQIFNSLMPALIIVLAIPLGLRLFQAANDLHTLQQGTLNPLEKPKYQPPADPDAMPEPAEKPKNGPPSLNAAIGLGDDGELIYADEYQPADEEPRYMRRLW